MPAAPKPTAMIMLASKQLWPNIHGLVHWHDHVEETRLTDVCIYYTTEENESAQPARRLERFCREHFKSIRVHRPDKGLGFYPHEVQRQIQTWMENRELQGRHWIINATGGSKLMFAGVVPFVGATDTRVVYRDLWSDEWYELERSAAGEITSRGIVVPPSEMNGVAVADLIRAQWEPADDAWRFDPPLSFDILELTEHGISNQWNWPATFAAVGYNSKEMPGVLFERYVAAALLEFDIAPDNLCASVKLRLGSDSESQSDSKETELVINHSGCVRVVDCKLLSREDKSAGKAEGMTTQVQTAADIQGKLGGLGAKTILLRPGWHFLESERMLCDAYRLKVVDPRTAWTLFDELAKFLGAKSLPASLQKAQHAIQQWRARTGAQYVFARPPLASRHRQASGASEAVIDVERVLDAQQKDYGDNWVAFWLNSKFHLRLKNAEQLTDSELRAQLERLFQEHCRRIKLSQSKAKSNYRRTAELVPKKNRRPRIEGVLEKYLGRSMFTVE